VSGARTLGTVSTVLTGAAIVSAGLGVVFWLSADDDAPMTGFNTRLEMTSGGAVARAGWVF
jgi:hypothetical protein